MYMPPLERIGLTGLCVLLAACTGVVDGPPGMPPPGSIEGPGSAPITSPPCSDASLLPTRVRKITDVQYSQLISELLPHATIPTVATPGTELALIKDDSKFVVRGPLAAQYFDGAFALAAQFLTQTGLVPCSPVPGD